MKYKFLIALICFVVNPTSSWAAEYDLKLIWQTPIEGEHCKVLSEDGRLRKCDRGRGIQLRHGVIRGNQLSFLGYNFKEGGADEILIDDLTYDGFNDYKIVDLQEDYNDLTWSMFSKNKGKPLILDITVDNQNKIWVVGDTERHHSWISDVTNRNYLASLDESGKTDFEKRYVKQSFSNLHQIEPYQDGTFIVVGGRNIGRISQAGEYLWNVNVGMAKGLSFAILGDNILAVGVAPHRSQKTDYWESYESKLLNADGSILNSKVIWEKVNFSPGAMYADIEVVADIDAFYVMTRWGDKFIRNKSAIKPINITKLSNSGEILWQIDLMSTLGKDSLGRVDICDHPTMVMDDKDLLLACTLSGNIRFYTFKNGQKEYEESSIPLPECHAPRVAKVDLFSMPDSKLYLVGTRASSNAAASCSWIGRLKSK